MGRRVKTVLTLGCAASLAILSYAGTPAAQEPHSGSGAASATVAAAGGSADQQMPVPTAVPPSAIDTRLADKGMSRGTPVLIRIFKQEAELELWMEKGGRFELFATYAICNWAGSLGPKLHEGDRQTPEGFYSIGTRQLHRRGRWPRSLDIGFPNPLDRANGRTGSYILIHGGCNSTGCFAMTNPQIEEIYTLSEQALRQGQSRIDVHVFPFRLTEANLEIYKDREWVSFWRTLKPGYDLFERTRIPPRVSVCNKAYVISEGSLPQNGMAPSPVARPADTDTCGINDTAPVVAAVPEEPLSARAAPNVNTRVAASKPGARHHAVRKSRKIRAAARRARVTDHNKRARGVRVAGSRRAH